MKSFFSGAVYKLDPVSVEKRAKGQPPVRKTAAWDRRASMVQGAGGFGLVGLLAFGVWAVGGRWLVTHLGVAGFYGLVAAVFMALAGLALGRLVIGPGAIPRFYGLFTVAFVLYSVVWCAVYFTVGGKLGEIFGSAGGLAVLCLTLLGAFGARDLLIPCWGVVFLFVSLGYYAGEPFHAWFPGPIGILIWGFCYGAGFGAGTGYLLFEAQRATRTRLDSMTFGPGERTQQ